MSEAKNGPILIDLSSAWYETEIGSEKTGKDKIWFISYESFNVGWDDGNGWTSTGTERHPAIIVTGSPN
ncbi:hypothetical protein ACQKOM_15435 [Peribacillus frigoritolerans]|jgi:hypothetical protein|uniref:hypothetical protein n=1 Tax=Peribacillus TaxID=2675229 RepID=UPI00138F22AC|nr:hypothetical protein [Peribacillus frigoritolerans]MBT2602122.1 hypothetical protein [Bacillus sp. ISL-53]QNK50628.1 hypothetical protein H7F28_10830 [Brevibacterium sp. PAMC23299]QYF81962.1 hypothetical protein KY492_23970 [Brevibacterium sp. PAMC21349]MCR8867640.1 hypothetical protein [Peribacillus frigoritolerans]MCY9003888.1 hypothetical protein [Peribacillus frigoritolerans]